MTADDMARELRAAGWEPYLPESGLRMFRDPKRRDRVCFIETAYQTLSIRLAGEELAQQRARGTVTTPVVGEEAE